MWSSMITTEPTFFSDIISTAVRIKSSALTENGTGLLIFRPVFDSHRVLVSSATSRFFRDAQNEDYPADGL
jgi:hypothetical protein